MYPLGDSPRRFDRPARLQPAPRRHRARQHHPAHRRGRRVGQADLRHPVAASATPSPSRRTRTRRFAASPTHQLVIIDVVVGERTAARRLPRDPVHPGAGLDPDPVRQPDRRRRGPDPLPRGRRGRRRWPSPFDARELEARVEALLLRFQRSKDLVAVISTDGITVTRVRRIDRGPQPEGRRRDVDHRDQHRDGGAPSTEAGSGRHRRPRPPVRPGRDHLNLSPRQTLADVVRDEAALREPELLRTYCDPPRQRPARPGRRRPDPSSPR